MRRSWWAPLALGSVLWVAMAGAADAATLVTRGDRFYSYVEYYADPGEKNDITVTSASGRVTLVDRGVTAIVPSQQALADCVFVLNSVSCRDRGVMTVVGLDLKDGDDAVIASRPVSVIGGPGADAVVGSAFASFRGGPGADRLGTSSGHFLYWTDEVGDVRVTTDGVADDGHAGEGDNVAPGAGVSVLGPGRHTLIGDDAPNDLSVSTGDGSTIAGAGGNDKLSGSAGPDLITGGDGDDDIHGNLGADDLDGGAGVDFLSGDNDDDVVRARDGEADELLECADGVDLLIADPIDPPNFGGRCEQVDLG
jgi:Ca2+-binding RTX toxin-like protein